MLSILFYYPLPDSNNNACSGSILDGGGSFSKTFREPFD